MLENIKLQHEKYGLSIKFKNRICKHDIKDSFMNEIRDFTKTLKNNFNVLLDFTEIKNPICGDSAQLIAIVRLYLIMKGAKRIVVIYRDNAQIVDLSKAFKESTNIKNKEIYISTLFNLDIAYNNASTYLMEKI